jgi:DNA gyrase subunit A
MAASKQRSLIEEPLLPVLEVEEIDIAGVIDKSMPAFSRAANLREIPDARDGFFPGRRRIMFTASDMGLSATSDFMKSARLTGECMGKYHPHGDMAIYSAVENLTADYKVRYPLIEGQGNWGSLDGDAPAAQRYTEIRLTRLGEQIVRDLGDEKAAIVPWRDNYDGKLREPALLPTRFPVLLANGIDGIGNGYATMILPHHLRELIAACVALIDAPSLGIEQLARLIPGPDFPGGGIMVGGTEEWQRILETGQGRVVARAKLHIETAGRHQKLVVTELPFRVVKGNRGKTVGAHEQIMVKVNGTSEDRAKGKVPPLSGIVSDVVDESDRKGMRLVIILEPGVSVERAVNALYAETGLQTAYTANYTVWANGLPEVMGTRQLLRLYLEYQFQVLTNRTAFYLRSADRELLISRARVIAKDNAPAILKIVEASNTSEDAVVALMAKYHLVREQAEAITEMQVRSFARLNIAAIKDRIAVLETNVAEYRRLLGSRAAMNEMLKSELREIAAKFGDERRTQVDASASSEVKSADELIEDEPCWLSLAQSGLIARLRGDAFKAQRRGGSGIAGTAKPEDDPVIQVLGARTRDRVWLLTDAGNLFGLRVADVEEVARGSKGMNVRRFLNLTESETIAKMVILPTEVHASPSRAKSTPKAAAAKSSADAEGQLVVATANGKVIRSRISDYANLSSGGLKAIGLDTDDQIISALVAASGTHLLAISSDGYAVRFDIDDVPINGRGAKGVVSQKLALGARVVSITAVSPEDSGDLAVVVSNGKGKRSKIVEYPLKGRATRGVVSVDLSTAGKGKPVSVVFAAKVGDDDEVFFTASSGKVVIMAGREIKRQGRATAGVTIVTLSTSVKTPETVTGGNVRVVTAP